MSKRPAQDGGETVAPGKPTVDDDGAGPLKRKKLSFEKGGSDANSKAEESSAESTALSTTNAMLPSSTSKPLKETSGFGATKPTSAIFGSLSKSTNPFGSSVSSTGNSTAFGFGAVATSKANSIFGTRMEGAFSSLIGGGGGSGGFGYAGAKSANPGVMAAFGDKTPAFGEGDDAKKGTPTNDIFREKIVAFGETKDVVRAQSPGLEKVDLSTGEENEETLLSLRAKLFKMVPVENDESKIVERPGASGNSDSNDSKITNEGVNSDSTDSSDGKERVAKANVPSMAWKMQGVGELRLKEEKSSSGPSGKPRRKRLIMRREYGAGSICGDVILNIAITKDLLCEKENDTNLRLSSFDASGTCLHLIRIKRTKDLLDLHRRINDYVQCMEKWHNSCSHKSDENV